MLGRWVWISLSVILFACAPKVVGDLVPFTISYEMFASSRQFSSSVFGSIEAMDGECATLASQVGLRLRYRALAVASGARLEDRFNQNLPVYIRISGQGTTLFALSLGAAVRGEETVAFAPRYDESGSLISGGSGNVATGLTTSGAAGANCSDWTTSTTVGVGAISSVASWAWGGSISCSSTVRIYCLGDEI